MTQRRGISTNPAWPLRQLDDLQPDAVRGRFGGWLLPAVALVDKGQFHRAARCLLHRCGQVGNLAPILGIGGGGMQRQQIPQGIDRGVELRALLALGAGIVSPCPTLRRRLQSAAVMDSRSRRRCRPAPRCNSTRRRFVCRQQEQRHGGVGRRRGSVAGAFCPPPPNQVCDIFRTRLSSTRCCSSHWRGFVAEESCSILCTTRSSVPRFASCPRERPL